MRGAQVLFVALLFLCSLTPFSYAQREQSVKINFYILNGQGLNTNYVGDHFYYQVHLENNDTDTITGVFTVNVLNTTRAIIHSREYKVSLEIGQSTDLYPNFTMNGREVQNIFFFDISGTYELEVVSSIPIAFYTYFPDGEYIFQHNVAVFFFDALPSSQKSLNDMIEAWVHENEASLKQSQEYTKQEMVTAQSLYRLTVLSFFVTVVNAVLVIWSTRQLQKHRGNLLFYIYLGVVVAVAILFLSGAIP